jgi:hypothetical protein
MAFGDDSHRPGRSASFSRVCSVYTSELGVKRMKSTRDNENQRIQEAYTMS